MFMFDRKQKTLQQEKVDHTFIEKVLNVVKERVDNSQRDVYKLEQKIFKLPQKMQCNTIFKIILNIINFYFAHFPQRKLCRGRKIFENLGGL